MTWKELKEAVAALPHGAVADALPVTFIIVYGTKRMREVSIRDICEGVHVASGNDVDEIQIEIE
jgi:hypothetical protein